MDKASITPEFVRGLLRAQFPEWADLPVTPVPLDGWDNTTFRLGDDMSVRLPSGDMYVAQVDKEHRWLPVLAPRLPLPIPQPLARGAPSDAFPRPWSVYRWIPGALAADGVADLSHFATDVASFLRALQRVDASDGPRAGAHSHGRGGPVATWDAQVRAAFEVVGDRIDVPAATAVWERALDAHFTGEPVWVHGDVVATNLLVRDGALSAVIDWGCSAVGDPACDVAIAWTRFEGDSKRAFRDALAADDGTWERGRGWALWKALLELHYGDVHDARAGQPGWRRMGWRAPADDLIAQMLDDG